MVTLGDTPPHDVSDLFLVNCWLTVVFQTLFSTGNKYCPLFDCDSVCQFTVSNPEIHRYTVTRLHLTVFWSFTFHFPLISSSSSSFGSARYGRLVQGLEWNMSDAISTSAPKNATMITIRPSVTTVKIQIVLFHRNPSKMTTNSLESPSLLH